MKYLSAIYSAHLKVLINPSSPCKIGLQILSTIVSIDKLQFYVRQNSYVKLGTQALKFI